MLEIADKSGEFLFFITERESPSANKVQGMLNSSYSHKEIAFCFNVPEERIKLMLKKA